MGKILFPVEGFREPAGWKRTGSSGFTDQFCHLDQSQKRKLCCHLASRCSTQFGLWSDDFPNEISLCTRKSVLTSHLICPSWNFIYPNQTTKEAWQDNRFSVTSQFRFVKEPVVPRYDWILYEPVELQLDIKWNVVVTLSGSLLANTQPFWGHLVDQIKNVSLNSTVCTIWTAELQTW